MAVLVMRGQKSEVLNVERIKQSSSHTAKNPVWEGKCKKPINNFSFSTESYLCNILLLMIALVFFL